MRGRTVSAASKMVMALVIFGMAALANGQPAAKMYRIGWLSNGSTQPGSDPGVADFQQGLRDLGYVEGKNVLVDYRYGNGSAERLNEYAVELVRLPVAVIVTSGDLAALAAKRATRATHIVAMELGLDPVKSGLVSSLGRPDGNVTGLATLNEELWQKRLALLKDLAPRVSRVAVLANTANPSNVSCVAEIKAAAPSLGIDSRAAEFTDARSLELAFASIVKAPPDALVTCWDSVTLASAKTIADFALKQRLPLLAPLKEYAQAGALISFGASLPAQRRRAAYYVDRIAKGAKAGDLAIEQPSYFELVINLKTAKALGVSVPPGFLVLADDLIQ